LEEVAVHSCHEILIGVDNILSADC